MSDRSATVDIAKGLGILLVVLGHSEAVLQTHGALYRVVYSFHIPLFFVLSGVFLSAPREIGPWAHARAEALLKPYLIVSLASGLALALVATARGRPGPSLLERLAGILYATSETIVWAPMWYLPHLFVAMVCSAWLIGSLRLEQRFGARTLSVSAAMLAVGISTCGAFWRPESRVLTSIGIVGLPGLPWSVDLLCVSTAWLLLGYACGGAIRSARFSPCALTLSAVGFAALHLAFDETINLNWRIYGHALVSTAQALLGICIAVQAAALLRRLPRIASVLAWLGNASLFVLIFHAPFQHKAHVLLSRLGADVCVASTGALVVAVTGSCALAAIVKRQGLLARLLLPRARSAEAPA